MGCFMGLTLWEYCYMTMVIFHHLFYTGWWFGTFFIFPYIGNNHPNWLIFFRGVQTTNQYIFKLIWSCTFKCNHRRNQSETNTPANFHKHSENTRKSTILKSSPNGSTSWISIVVLVFWTINDGFSSICVYFELMVFIFLFSVEKYPWLSG